MIENEKTLVAFPNYSLRGSGAYYLVDENGADEISLADLSAEKAPIVAIGYSHIACDPLPKLKPLPS